MLTHRQLSLFRAIMLHGSLGRAADACHTSQPTVSRELARLEQLLGYTLFDRVGGRLRPTVRAQALMREVQRSFVGLEQVTQRALALRQSDSTRLRLACLPALAHALVPPALARLHARFPQAQVGVEALESPWLEQALSEQRYDMGLCETEQAPAGARALELLQAHEVAVLPAAHPLCAKAQLQPQDFAGLPFVSLAADDPYRQAIDALFAREGVTRQMQWEASSAVAVCALVAQGLGVAIVNPLTAAAMASAALVQRPLSVGIPFGVHALLPQVAPEHPLCAPLLQALGEHLASMAARGGV